ncbi:MAG TPA: polysaccharide biosynthesis/export family protein [Usitatibacter sp.]|jgi:polysaccharide export outer membrane protein|nr:polysaccharide biosynthesis/export family protein [Usitatibacter sp.]
MATFRTLASLLIAAILASACGSVPTSGPRRSEIEDSPPRAAAVAAIQVVDVDEGVARRLLEGRSARLFSDTLGDHPAGIPRIGVGDVVEVTLWEAAPATLFGGAALAARGPSGASPATSLPEQAVDADGLIDIPFAGRVRAAGRQPHEIAADIVQRLKGKANQPEAMVRRVRNASANVTIVGEVTTSTRVPILTGTERLLDAVAAAAGVRQPVSKTTIQVTRGSTVQSMPLDAIIADPRQNISLVPGDVVTAMFQPLTFTALGATGKNEEIGFEAQGITLAQALARAGGLADARSDPQGVFIFRFEPRDALPWPHQPVMATPDGRVPVIYRVNLKDPGSFFVMQSFAIRDKDVLYVSNAPIADVQKVMNVVLSAIYPLIAFVQLTH